MGRLYNSGMISVIIPMFNTGKECKRLVSGILTKKPQSFEDNKQELEVICVDDASTDDSYDTLWKSFAQDECFTLLRQSKNSGAAAARNRALEVARGDLIVFLDSDDDIRADFLQKMTAAMKDENIALAVCGIRQKYLHLRKTVDKFTKAPVSREANETLKHYALRTMVKDAHLYSSVNKIYRGEIIRKNSLRFREELDFAEDTTFVLDYLADCDTDDEIIFITEPLYVYNYGTDTSVVSESSLEWRNWQRNFDDIKAWADADSQNDLRKLYQRFKISHALAVARSPKPWRSKIQYLNPIALFFASLVVKIRS